MNLPFTICMLEYPTLQNIRIRSTRDCLLVFYGVATNRLHLNTRRLYEEERRSIVAGNVYVWEERRANSESSTGLCMKRWTDGMVWGPSRVRNGFLFYHQRDSIPSNHLFNLALWPTQAQKTRWPCSQPVKPYTDGRSVSDADRLIKQTYSIHVSLPSDSSKEFIRKWHLTAYFSPAKLQELDTIDNLHDVGDVVVPEGWFWSAQTDRPSSSSAWHKYPSQQFSPGSPYSFPKSPHSYSRATSPTLLVYSSSVLTTPSPLARVHSYHGHLVPLDVLVQTSGPKRDPTDEQILRRFHP